MIDASSLKEKARIVNGIAIKLYPFNSVIFLIGSNNILDFETRQGIRLIGKRQGAAIFFADSKPEAESSKAGMLANLEVYKKILNEALGGKDKKDKLLAIINHCLKILNSAEFLRIVFSGDNIF